MRSLSEQDVRYLQKIASGRIRMFRWYDDLWLLGPAVFMIALWVGFFKWIQYHTPPGTQWVICLWDGKKYQPSEHLLDDIASLGFLALLFVCILLFIALRCLRMDRNRLVRISQFAASHLEGRELEPGNRMHD